MRQVLRLDQDVTALLCIDFLRHVRDLLRWSIKQRQKVSQQGALSATVRTGKSKAIGGPQYQLGTHQLLLTAKRHSVRRKVEQYIPPGY